MLNVGGLVRYPMGAGGVVLCNLLFKPNEEVPLNGVKKQNILATILRNLKAPFAGSDTVTLAANLTYTPIDISKQANQYRDEKGWFDRTFTFADLPTGKQKFAGVNYDVYEFATSPVPTVIMLGGPKHLPTSVTGIAVNQKADSLFFLQTARIDKPLSRDETAKGTKVELFHYIVNYAAGSTETVPVYLGADIENYKQPKPKQLPAARIAWTQPYPGTDFSAVAYSQEWDNPRKDVTIASIDVVTGQCARGVPVVLAITAGVAK
jgi:beta-galactosidase